MGAIMQVGRTWCVGCSHWWQSTETVLERSFRDLPEYCGEHPAFRIELKGAGKITPVWRIHPDDKELQDKMCAELRDCGIIEPSSSTAFRSAPTFPRKKDEFGNWTLKRFCLDYRGVNDKTKSDPSGCLG